MAVGVSNKVTATLHAHNEIHEGNGYSGVQKEAALGAGSSKYLLAKMPDATGTEGHVKFTCGGDASFLMEVFVAPTVNADGTPVTTPNLNRGSANTPDLDLFHTPTIGADGTLVFADYAGASKTAGSASHEDEIVLDSSGNTYALLKVTNTSVAAGNYALGCHWYEE